MIDILFLFLFALVLCVAYEQTLFFALKKPLVLGGANKNCVVFGFFAFVRWWVGRIFNAKMLPGIEPPLPAKLLKILSTRHQTNTKNPNATLFFVGPTKDQGFLHTKNNVCSYRNTKD